MHWEVALFCSVRRHESQAQELWWRKTRAMPAGDSSTTQCRFSLRRRACVVARVKSNGRLLGGRRPLLGRSGG
ncbi:unnamed protein product [Ectocarpus sp. 4 AP-2014]